MAALAHPAHRARHDSSAAAAGAGSSRDACYCHENQHNAELPRGSALDPAVLAAVFEVDGGSDVDEDEMLNQPTAADDDEEETHPSEPMAIKAAKLQIRGFYESGRSSDLELPSSLSRAARKQLHTYADTYSLHHIAVGPEGHRRLIISRWRPIEPVMPSVGAKAARLSRGA